MMKPGTTKPPLFCIHAISGNVFFYQKLVHHLEQTQPVYGLQAQGLDGKQPPRTSLTEMASHYINEIRAVQPEGPYYLGGYSFGGLVAFEMAQQLHAQGQKIAVLAIFDTPAPGYHHVYASESNDSKLSQLLGRSFFHVSKLLKLSIKEQLDYLWGRFWWHLTEGKLNFGYKMYLRYIMRSVQDLRHLEILAANHQARDGYIPQSYPGQLTLFQATERPQGFDNEPGLGWSHWVTGGVEYYEIPGFHLNMMEEPQVRLVAEKLQYGLDKSQAEQKQLIDKFTKEKNTCL
jgi:thioesterase domain-containing protein